MATANPDDKQLERTEWYAPIRGQPSHKLRHKHWLQEDPSWKTTAQIELLKNSRGETADVSDAEFTAAQLLIDWWNAHDIKTKFRFHAPQRAPDKDGKPVFVPPTIDGTLVMDLIDKEVHQPVEIKTTHSVKDNNVYFYTSEYQHKSLADRNGMYWIVNSTTLLGLEGNAKKSAYRSTLYSCYWTAPSFVLSVRQELEQQRETAKRKAEDKWEKHLSVWRPLSTKKR